MTKLKINDLITIGESGVEALVVMHNFKVFNLGEQLALRTKVCPTDTGNKFQHHLLKYMNTDDIKVIGSLE